MENKVKQVLPSNIIPSNTSTTTVAALEEFRGTTCGLMSDCGNDNPGEEVLNFQNKF